MLVGRRRYIDDFLISRDRASQYFIYKYKYIYIYIYTHTYMYKQS